jgi:hypothetical protein
LINFFEKPRKLLSAIRSQYMFPDYLPQHPIQQSSNQATGIE